MKWSETTPSINSDLSNSQKAHNSTVSNERNHDIKCSLTLTTHIIFRWWQRGQISRDGGGGLVCGHIVGVIVIILHPVIMSWSVGISYYHIIVSSDIILSYHGQE